jgi:type III secretion protein L
MQRLMVIDKNKLLINDSKIVKAETYSKVIDTSSLQNEVDEYAQRIRANIDNEIEIASKQGYQDGMAQANRDFAVRMTDNVMRLEASYIGLEARLVNTIMNTLKSILGSIDDNLLMEKLIRQLIHTTGQEKKLSLRISVEQFDKANHILKDIISEYPHIEFIDVIKDPNMQVGGCVIETEYGAVDGSLEQQLNTIRQSLINTFAGKRTEQKNTQSYAGQSQLHGDNNRV